MGRNTAFDAAVTPFYRSFPHSAEAVEGITAKYYKPPAEVVKRWIELCRPQGWLHRGSARVICLDPLDILPEANALTLDMLRIYVSTIGT